VEFGEQSEPLSGFMKTKTSTITTHSSEETFTLGRKIGSLIADPILLGLSGDLGSGKTVFVQGLAKGLEVPPEYYITSPTFTLVNEYPGRLRLFHIDLYRLDHYADLEDIGLDDILSANAVAAIEWAEKLPDDLRAAGLALNFDIIGDDTRKINVNAYGHAAAGLIKALGLMNS
jgi:tRNA threonylcarbamoyladenosine biosynthesis protein TsaE